MLGQKQVDSIQGKKIQAGLIQVILVDVVQVEPALVDSILGTEVELVQLQVFDLG